MNDFIIRLASMKLAELKFQTKLIRENPSTPRHPKRTTREMSLKQIKEMIKIVRGSSDPTLIGEYMYGYTTYFRMTSQNMETILDISKPEGMDEEVFYKIIKTLGIPLKKY